MPRRRSTRIRAGAPRHRTREATTVIDGLSSRALSLIRDLEHSRNYLNPGDVGAALRLWKAYVHRPERQLWHDHEWGNAHADCCDDPFEARALLDVVMQAMPPRQARELRRIVSRSDAVWNAPSPPSPP
ncbi:hypothetical protein QA811_31200 [Streptomyces sp. B21-102]|uniref:hypothetical protein n=1 Tax=unclassified Streptomyces TaxID=2593676 RepID=UPI00267D2CCE